jgi:ELWxxDGT repeat protein
MRGPFFGKLGTRAYFSACEAATGCELWRTDGTAVGTVLAADLQPGRWGSYVDGFRRLGRWLLFVAIVSDRSMLCRIDESTEQITPLVSFSGYIEDVAVASGGAFASVCSWNYLDFPPPCELWRVDGTPSGTRPVRRDDYGFEERMTLSSNLAVFRRDVVFGSWWAAGLWRLNASTEDATAIIDLDDGNASSNPKSLTTAGGTLFFVADEGAYGYDTRLFVTDGTRPGTKKVADVFHYNPSMTALGRSVLFPGVEASTGGEPWISDGSPAGTRLVADLYPGRYPSNSSGLFTAGHAAFFSAWSGSGGTLWRTDGTARGTRPVDDVTWEGLHAVLGTDAFVTVRGPAYNMYSLVRVSEDGEVKERLDEYASWNGISELATIGDSLFFAARTASFPDGALFKSDGTSRGTHLVLSSQRDGVWGVRNVTRSGGATFFSASSSGTTGLWKTDGTPGGSSRVKELPIVAGNYGPVSQLTDVGGTLFFTVDDGVHGAELWKTDGTESGTVLVKDINPGLSGSKPQSLTAVGGLLLFAATDGEHGVELWRSDGTPEGTMMVQDIAPGPAASEPSSLTTSCGILYFTADDGAHGRELWALPVAALGTGAVSAPTDLPCHVVNDAGPAGTLVRGPSR